MASDDSKVDSHLRLKLADLDPIQFEKFFLSFFATRPELTVLHHGRTLTRRVATASTYAAGSGRKDRGVDVRLEMEGGEIWAVQCKRVEEWTVPKTLKAIAATHEFEAKHYILAVACDVSAEVHDEIARHGTWTLWNLDTICTEFRQRVPVSLQPRCLPFLWPDELAKFLPYATDALISPEQFFRGRLGSGAAFRHDWKLVGRQATLSALMDFVAAGKPRTLLLKAAGGEGKSRLLLELARRLEQESPVQYEVVFLNPASKDERPERGLVTEAKRLVVLVDDAHRIENLPRWLLEWVRQDGKAKVVLAARPQGGEAVRRALQDAGVDPAVPEVALEPLTGGQVRELATEVLGESAADRVPWLLARTKDSPFLTVLAGDLLRKGEIEVPADLGDEEFRRKVLQAFETSNLLVIPESDRERSKALLRLLALLSPVERSVEFADKAARCLDWSSFDVETALDRLGALKLTAGTGEKLRVVPDLFADFLVYDLCYGSRDANRRWMDRVLAEFADSGPAMLRNLAEAAWLARRDGKEDPKFMARLLEAEWARFEKAGFGQRAGIIGHWVRFSVFLPREALELARRAMALKTAPEDPEADTYTWFGSSRPSQRTVLRQLPALLEPIAVNHPEHQSEALDLLWALGFEVDWKDRPEDRKQAWAAMADILRFQTWKEVGVTERALDWLEHRLRRGELSRVLSEAESALSMLLEPCFASFVESMEAKAARVFFIRRPVVPERTRGVRTKALRILEHIAEQGGPRAALQAVSAATAGFARVQDFGDGDPTANQVELERWRAERIRALGVLRQALKHHKGLAVRVYVRIKARELAAWDPDLALREEGRSIEQIVPEDGDIRLAEILLPRLGRTVGELAAGVLRDAPTVRESQERRYELQWTIVRSRLESSVTAASFLEQVCAIAGDLRLAGERPDLGGLYFLVSKFAPTWAERLAGHILVSPVDPILIEGWPILQGLGLGVRSLAQRPLLGVAARHADPRVRAELVRYLGQPAIGEPGPLEPTEKNLVEILASMPDPTIALGVLNLIQRVPAADMDWAWSLLIRLPLEALAEEHAETVVEALVPRGCPGSMASADVVRVVLGHLVPPPRLQFSQFFDAWQFVCSRYARDVYQLVLARIEFFLKHPAPKTYSPIPLEGINELRLPGLAGDPEFPAICDELWRRVTSQTLTARSLWVSVFQMVVICGSEEWSREFMLRVLECRSIQELELLVRLLCFPGSRLVLRHPGLARVVLEQGKQLCWNESRAALYRTLRPQCPIVINGRRDPNDDHVEAEAIRAAEAHAEDPVLGPFYRWIVQVEELERRRLEQEHQARMAALESSTSMDV